LKNLSARLQAEEVKIKNTAGEDRNASNVSFKAEINKNKYVKCYKCNRVGHTKLQCDKKTACSICKKGNHVEEMCYFRNKILLYMQEEQSRGKKL
jgi:hypothetical protein